MTIEIQYFEGSAPEDAQQEIKDKEGNVSYKYYRTMKYRQPVRFHRCSSLMDPSSLTKC